MERINIKDFSEYPGPRYMRLGPNSGEEFRDSILIPMIKKHGSQIVINLDGVMGYGSSFLEESFGGLIRAGIPHDLVNELVQRLVSDDDPSRIYEIKDYVQEEISRV